MVLDDVEFIIGEFLQARKLAEPLEFSRFLAFR